ncbi:loganic acid O-methyltransferase-like isoform X2 [Syzygium oleosum]|uniref:loganic acid O-methyltransferase-like isoform X2 n=1 Tax=Syzygium oleosum TaxID=219896 RepID=UPI0024B98875|nr:loganic acid O-methyltransferase-like isoform X2 [Syzygium oleosum]
MNLIHSAFALHWLSKVPEEVKVGSHARTEGRIPYAGGSRGVTEAFASQFQRDMEEFFEVRSKEMVEDGLLMPCRPDGIVASEFMLMHMSSVRGMFLQIWPERAW